MNIFEQATRRKVRFETDRGRVSTEDLWDLPLTSEKRISLDYIAIALNNEVKDTTVKSFVMDKPTVNLIAKLKFDVVKHVIDVKLAEREAAKDTKAKAEKKQRLLELIAHKKDEQLTNLSIDELNQMVNDL